MKSFIAKISDNHGQSLVEFALVLPFLLLILVGIVEVGRMWETANVVTSAAREGARVAAVTAPNISQVRAAAQNVLNAGSVSGATISVSGPTIDSQVSVTIRVNYSPIIRSFIPGLNNVQITRSTTMLWEG